MKTSAITDQQKAPKDSLLMDDSTPQMRQSDKSSLSAQEVLRLDPFGDDPFPNRHSPCEGLPTAVLMMRRASIMFVGYLVTESVSQIKTDVNTLQKNLCAGKSPKALSPLFEGAVCEADWGHVVLRSAFCINRFRCLPAG